jgi:HD superfamily phosphodiesterase
MITPTYSIENKQAEVGRLATLIDDRRLDWQEAIGLAIDAMTKYQPSYALMSPKDVLRLVEPERFMFIKMQTLCVRAMTILMQEAAQ